MNILVPDSWLREHLKTKATRQQITKYLSLSSQSVEKTTKVGNDWVYDIEITTNRPDCLAIYGIARELAAILPRYGLTASLKKLAAPEIPQSNQSLPLDVKITKASLCPRFTAIILDNISVKPSPKIIRKHLLKAGVRPLNNVVDISNYLMLELNQPMHTFDYDKIKGAKMILHQSQAGESIVTLDNVKRDLPEGSMIIKDGQNRIIDLCGTMGGANSAVDEKTTRVLLFVQTYDPIVIRRECQKLNFRTEASARFEKGVEPEGVLPAMKKAIKMFKKNCNARAASQLIDIYPEPPEKQIVSVSFALIRQQLGVQISKKEVLKILESLGFKTKLDARRLTLDAIVPHWRLNDICIPEDLVEEVARIYGYHRLPNLLPTGDFPQPFKSSFNWEEKAKGLLKNWGFTEVYTYSMQSQKLIMKAGLDPEKCLSLKNPLSQEFQYMRTSLIPSLLQVIADNQAFFKKLKIFELANIYLPAGRQVCQLPEEKQILAGIMTGSQFYQAKGVVEVIFKELGIKSSTFTPLHSKLPLWHPGRTALINNHQELLGIVGEVHPQVLARFEIKTKAVVFNLDGTLLFRLAKDKKIYTPISQYPSIIEDLCFLVRPKTAIGDLIRLIKQTSSIIKSVDLIDSFNNQRTIRITYQHSKQTLTDKEVEKIRKKIIEKAKIKFKAVLKE